MNASKFTRAMSSYLIGLTQIGSEHCSKGNQHSERSCSEPKFLQCCHFSEISAKYFTKHFGQIFLEILHDIVKYGKHCECDIIETYDKYVKYGNQEMFGENRPNIMKYWIIYVVFLQNTSGNKVKHFVKYNCGIS